MNGIRIKSKENGALLSLDFSIGRADNAPQTGLLIFAGNADSNKHILAQATFEQFNTPSTLYGLLSGDVKASECLEASAHRICVATIHAESESDVLESLSRLDLNMTMQRRGIFATNSRYLVLGILMTEKIRWL